MIMSKLDSFNCNGCGRVVLSSLDYCDNCGKKLIKPTKEESSASNVSEVVCSGCGKQMQSSLEYCSNCGKKLIYKMNNDSTTKQFDSQEKSHDQRAVLLEKIDVYAEAMHFMTTFARFDAAKFEILDDILSKADANFGTEKRREMLLQSERLLPDKTTGGIEELRVILVENLTKAFIVLNRLLSDMFPTPETAIAVKKILDKYNMK
jgi:predicted amidophosphoribosyltransferase